MFPYKAAKLSGPFFLQSIPSAWWSPRAGRGCGWSSGLVSLASCTFTPRYPRKSVLCPTLPCFWSLCGFSGPLVACDLSTVKSLTNNRFESNLHGLVEARFLEWGAVPSTRHKAAANSAAQKQQTASHPPLFLFRLRKTRAASAQEAEDSRKAACTGCLPLDSVGTLVVPRGLVASPQLFLNKTKQNKMPFQSTATQPL